jgi:hypothetical protein
MRESSIAFKLSVEGRLFRLKIFEVLEFCGQGCLERSLEALAQFT